MLLNLINKRRAEALSSNELVPLAKKAALGPIQVVNKANELSTSTYNKVSTFSNSFINKSPQQVEKRYFSLKPSTRSHHAPVKFGPSCVGDVCMGARTTIKEQVDAIGRERWEQMREAGVGIQLDKIMNTGAIKTASDGTLFMTRMQYFKEIYEAAYDKAKGKKVIRTRLDISTDWSRDLGHSDGDMRYKKIQDLLNNMTPGLVRSPDQITFHDHFGIAVLPHIYGADWEANCVRVMEELKLDKIAYEVLIMTPRRWGKTWSVAMFVLALALCVPGIRIAIFSTGGRASGNLIQTLKAFMKGIPGAEDRICKSAGEELFLAASPVGGVSSAAAKSAQAASTTSKIYSYPSEVAGKYFLFHIDIDSFVVVAKFG